MINSGNIRAYINFLHLKKHSAPATEELMDRWAAVPEQELLENLRGLYLHWGIDKVTAEQYEQSFIQIQLPTQSSSVTLEEPIALPFNPTLIEEPKKRNIPLLIVIILLAATGVGLFLYSKNKKEEPLPSVSKAVEHAVTTPKPPPAVEQNATEPEQSVSLDLTVEDETNIDIIRSLIAGEEARDINEILNKYAPEVEQYWDMRNPTKEELINRYNSVWAKSEDGKHNNIKIDKVGNNAYDLYADYEFFSVKDQTTKSVIAHIRYVFDNEHEIIKVFSVP